MNLRLVVSLAASLSILVSPASSTSLLAAAAAVKGSIIEAGLSALKSRGGSETVIIQSKPPVAEKVPANQITVQDLSYLHNAQTVTYTSSNPISRLWEAVSNVIAAKAKAIGNLLSPNHRVIIVVPTTTEKATEKPKPVLTIDLEGKPEIGHKPSQWQTIGLPTIDVEVNQKPISLPTIDVELNHKPVSLPTIDVELNQKPISLPTIDVELNQKPIGLPTIDVELNQKPISLPTIDVELNHKPISLPTIDIELNHKPISMPTIDIELNHKPISSPTIDVELNQRPLVSSHFGISRDTKFRRIQPVAYINYLKK